MIENVVYTGEDSINVVFFAESFTVDQEELFNAKVTQAIQSLLYFEPLKSNSGKFNFYKSFAQERRVIRIRVLPKPD
jgi:hypothetical protein